MTDNKIYEELVQYQGKRLRDIDIHAIVDAVIEAGRQDDLINLPIELKMDDDRIITFLSFDYQKDEFEEVVISTPFNTYNIPAVTTSDNTNYRAIDTRIKNTLRNYTDAEVYIDMKYLFDREQETQPIQDSREYWDSQVHDEDYISQTAFVNFNEETDKNKEAEMESEILTKKRTRIESDYDISLNDVANELRKAGYFVKSKPGGSLLVTDENLSQDNSITVTKKNAYIETAELKTPETKALYEKMREAVINKMNQNLASTKEKYELIEASPRLAELSTQSIVRDMMTVFNTDTMTDKPDYKDVFDKPKQKYSFKDQEGNDYINISLGYSIKENSQAGQDPVVVPVILVTYGPEYGDVTKSFEVSNADMKSFEKDQLYKSDIMKDIDDFISIGTKDRDSIYKEMKYVKYDQAVDKIANKEFKNLSKEKAKFFADMTKSYYRSEKKKPFTEYMLDNIEKAPFFKTSMLTDNGKESLKKMFDEMERKIVIPDLSDLKLSKISQSTLSYTIEEAGEISYDSKVKEPVEYDREWITKLAMMQDKLIELRNGPVQDVLDTAHSIVKGVNEARQGVVGVYKDGIYSGLEFGNGIGSFKEGLNYGHVLHNMESEYRNLINSEKSQDQIAAINKKIDIKLYRDDIIRNANIYVKAAVTIRDKIDNMIDLISAAKTRAEANLKFKYHTFITSPEVRMLEENFKKLSSGIVGSFKELGYSFSEIGKGVAMIGSGSIGFGKEKISLIHNKSAIALNDFKIKYNDVVKDAKVVLNSKEFAKDRIAENINDFRISQSFNGIQSKDFYKVAETRFWCELDKTIESGKAATQIDPEERSDIEMESIQLAKQAAWQKEQNLFIADRLNSQIKENIIKDENMNLDKAVVLLAAEYHQAAMAFNVMNGASSIKAYQDLSDSEKGMCKDIILNILREMPNVSEKLSYNQEKMQMSVEDTKQPVSIKEDKTER